MLSLRQRFTCKLLPKEAIDTLNRRASTSCSLWDDTKVQLCPLSKLPLSSVLIDCQEDKNARTCLRESTLCASHLSISTKSTKSNWIAKWQYGHQNGYAKPKKNNTRRNRRQRIPISVRRDERRATMFAFDWAPRELQRGKSKTHSVVATNDAMAGMPCMYRHDVGRVSHFVAVRRTRWASSSSDQFNHIWKQIKYFE